jgi:TonB family protein
MPRPTLILAAALAVVAGGFLAMQLRTNFALRARRAALQRESQPLAAVRRTHIDLTREAAEAGEFLGDETFLPRLRDETLALQRRHESVARAEQARAQNRRAVEEAHDVAQLDVIPRARASTRPEYPAELRSRGIGGTVVVEFVVDRDGAVREARAVHASLNDHAAGAALPAAGEGSPEDEAVKLLGVAAVEAVEKWRFSAGQKANLPVNARLRVPIVFSVPKPPASAPAAPLNQP